MSREGSAALERLDAHDLRIAVVAARWHDEVVTGLIGGAHRALDACGVLTRRVARVPGSFELPLVAKALAEMDFHAVVALGVVVRGATPHFDYACRAVTDGLTRVALDTNVPIGFGVLTCDDLAQARYRAGLPDSREDKGFEATHAAIATALTLRHLRAFE